QKAGTNCVEAIRHTKKAAVASALLRKRAAELQAPSWKLPASSKLTGPNLFRSLSATLERAVWSLVIGVWFFSGACCLELGAFLSGRYRFINISFHGCIFIFGRRDRAGFAPLVTWPGQEPVNERHGQRTRSQAP